MPVPLALIYRDVSRLPLVTARALIVLWAASAARTAGAASAATAHPHRGGGACPRSDARGRMNRNPASARSSVTTAPRRSRLVVQPKEPGQRLVERQANTFAICPSTTAAKAAPDAASSAGPVGNWPPGRQPAAVRATTNADISTKANAEDPAQSGASPSHRVSRSRPPPWPPKRRPRTRRWPAGSSSETRPSLPPPSAPDSRSRETVRSSTPECKVGKQPRLE